MEEDSDISTDEGRWLTYAQLAEVRRIDKASAIKLATRRHWRRRKDNHGVMTVCVPVDAQAPDMRAADDDREPFLETARELSRSFDAALARLTESNEAIVAQLHAEIARLKQELEGEAATRRLMETEHRVKEAERQARGLLARLRAWRG